MIRIFKPRTEPKVQKVVIIGIDFGTSFTKVYFNQEGIIKKPIEFNVNEDITYFLPTELFYNSSDNKLYFHKQAGCERLKYFKYSMINDDLVTSRKLKSNNSYLTVKPEFLCSVYFLAYLIKKIKEQISEILKTNEIKYTINMGCPIDNFSDKNKGSYDKALTIAYLLSDMLNADGMTIKDLFSFYNNNYQSELDNLQTVPELYAEALWFIEQPSTGEGIYTVLDIGGGTVDFASIYINRTNEGEKETTIYSQNVIPFGIEILLQNLYPKEYDSQRELCLNYLKYEKVEMPSVWEKKYDNILKLKIAHDFDVKFASGIAEIKERNYYIMDNQNSIQKHIPYYSFGGGADFKWYHSIIDAHAHDLSRANIPPLKRQIVNLNKIPHNRLIIAEQLTRPTFPPIKGFPWYFKRECLFSGIDRDEPFDKQTPTGYDTWLEDAERQNELYPY